MKEQILQKLGLTERGAFNILKDATLCDRILTEDVIWIVDFFKIYDIPKNSIQNAIKNNYISHFSNTEQKGGKVFIFEKEALSFFPLNYSSNLINDNAMFVFKIYFEIAKITLSERQSQIAYEIIILKEPIQKISEKYNISTTSILEILKKSKRRLMHSSRLGIFSEIDRVTKMENELYALKKKEQELLYEISILKGKGEGETKPKNPILEKRLVDFDLSVRALVCLRNHSIDTVEELISCDKSLLLSFRNLGKKTLKEIEEFLKTLKL